MSFLSSGGYATQPCNLDLRHGFSDQNRTLPYRTSLPPHSTTSEPSSLFDLNCLLDYRLQIKSSHSPTLTCAYYLLHNERSQLDYLVSPSLHFQEMFVCIYGPRRCLKNLRPLHVFHVSWIYDSDFTLYFVLCTKT